MKNIVFVRHAHRDTYDKSEDNGLSSKGREQVENLVTQFKNSKLPKARLFWSSPKLRCQETLQPLANLNDSQMIIEPLLDEQTSEESHKDFMKRVKQLAKKISALSETIYVCSHGDVLPELVDELTSWYVELRKSQAIVAVESDGQWTLK